VSSLSYRPEPASTAARARRAKYPGIRLTLRAKGIIALAVLALYEAGIGLYVTHERARLMHIVQQLEHTNLGHEQLSRVNDGLAHSIVGLQQSLNSDKPVALIDPVRLDLAAVSSSLSGIGESYPETLGSLQRFEQLVGDLALAPSAETLIALRDTEQQLTAKIAPLELQTQQQARLLTVHYSDLNHHINVFILLATGLGLVCFGAAVTLFFSKLASDISKLEARAMAVVGEDGATLRELSRHDEVGGLMQAINRMQAELQRREQLQEISRQQLLHQEKMAAIGSIAATLAHEIGNPINSISGIAQHTIDAIRGGERLDSRALLDNAQLTVRQSERVASIVRQLADLSAPRRPDPELLNLNELVQTTCSFVRYDKRFRNAELVSDLDRGLPAVRAVTDHLTQILMNLLINAADALEGSTDSRPTIRVSTRQVGGEITLSVHDNGHGMSPTVLAQAFRQSFTTKPAGKGRGIGLYLCKKLIEDLGGLIELDSTVGTGTTARIRLPCTNATGANAMAAA
jgi:two-component system NtrC family sensor kinase